MSLTRSLKSAVGTPFASSNAMYSFTLTIACSGVGRMASAFGSQQACSLPCFHGEPGKSMPCLDASAAAFGKRACRRRRRALT